jgi:PIN domain nuclease of toxin-antitoxin system
LNLLLDTHILIWWATDDRKLPEGCRELLASPSNTVYFSSLSIWEVAIKHARGALRLSAEPLREQSLLAGLLELPFLSTHAARVEVLPPHHADPFDRGLIAQALSQSFVLVSQDEYIRQYDLQLRYF